ncbi:hypothetical protein [Aquamicrobium soli]|uniref:Uncharacterized protein n=1 Tax=Aquamicrobium soli TaxID=1811518 RepID=A0ABV7KK04_9HYPH
MAKRFDYGRMQGTATRLLDRFQQGTVSLKRTVTVPGENEWDPPTETSETWPLKAAVKRVDQRYENGVLIVETVDIVTFAAPDTVPVITDTLVIDGRERAITSLKPTPAAGTVVAWKAVVAV